jgi:ATP-dependent DNA ligase
MPSLQNYTAAAAPLVYYVFDVIVLRGQDVTVEPLSTRLGLLQSQVLVKLGEPIRESPELDARLSHIFRPFNGRRVPRALHFPG